MGKNQKRPNAPLEIFSLELIQAAIVYRTNKTERIFEPPSSTDRWGLFFLRMWTFAVYYSPHSTRLPL